MKYCSNCGQPLNDGTKFCTHCGAKLESAASPQSRNPNEETQRASAVAGEVVLSSWENPNPKPQQTQPQGDYHQPQGGGYQPQGGYNQPQGRDALPQREPAYSRSPVDSIKANNKNNDRPEKKKKGKGCLGAIMIAIGVFVLLYILIN